MTGHHRQRDLDPDDDDDDDNGKQEAGGSGRANDGLPFSFGIQSVIPYASMNCDLPPFCNLLQKLHVHVWILFLFEISMCQSANT